MTSDNEKNLQRQLSGRTESIKELTRALIEQKTSDVRLNELTKAFTIMAKQLGQFDDSFTELADSVDAVDAERVRTSEYAKELDSVLAGDTDLSETQLEKVFELIRQGKLDEAVKVVKTPEAPENLEEEIERRVMQRLASKYKIDTSEPVGTPKSDSFDFDEDFLKLSPEARASDEAVEKLLKYGWGQQ